MGTGQRRTGVSVKDETVKENWLQILCFHSPCHEGSKEEERQQPQP
jgi:hypothetical protein